MVLVSLSLVLKSTVSSSIKFWIMGLFTSCSKRSLDSSTDVLIAVKLALSVLCLTSLFVAKLVAEELLQILETKSPKEERVLVELLQISETKVPKPERVLPEYPQTAVAILLSVRDDASDLTSKLLSKQSVSPSGAQQTSAR